MKYLAANNKACWVGNFAHTYPFTAELCGGCPACRRKNLLPYNSWHPFRVWGQEYLLVTGRLSGLLSTWLGCGKEVLLYHPDAEPFRIKDLTALIQGLLKAGVRQVVIPEPGEEEWQQMLTELPSENIYYSIFSLPEMLEEEAQPLFTGPVALVYPTDKELCHRAYRWTQGYLRQQEGGQVVHIAPKSMYIDCKKLSERVEGGCYSVYKLIAKDNTEIDWI